jgi:hypothetical protein
LACSNACLVSLELVKDEAWHEEFDLPSSTVAIRASNSGFCCFSSAMPSQTLQSIKSFIIYLHFSLLRLADLVTSAQSGPEIVFYARAGG